MAQHDDREYEETVDPKNPPNSVLAPEVRNATLTTFLGGIVVFFLIVTAALVYWRTSGDSINPDPGLREGEEAAAERRDEVGTAGDPSLNDTRDEIRYRGGDDGSAAELNDILKKEPSSLIGTKVTFHNIDVAATGAGRFWIHDGNARVEVVQPAGSAAIREGQDVDITGTVESDGATGIRIRAERVTLR
jgi:hypothetical protein